MNQDSGERNEFGMMTFYERKEKGVERRHGHSPALPTGTLSLSVASTKLKQTEWCSPGIPG